MLLIHSNGRTYATTVFPILLFLTRSLFNCLQFTVFFFYIGDFFWFLVIILKRLQVIRLHSLISIPCAGHGLVPQSHYFQSLRRHVHIQSRRWGTLKQALSLTAVPRLPLFCRSKPQFLNDNLVSWNRY